MSKDIRSFFSTGAKSSAAPKAPTSAQKRKPIVLDDSDSENDQKPYKSKASKANDSSKSSKKRRVIYSSDDEDEPKPKTKDTSSTLASKAAKLKAVNVNNALGSAPVKRIEKEKKPKLKKPNDVFDADTDDMELMQVDEDVLMSPIATVKRESSQNEHNAKKAEKHTPKKGNDVLKTKNVKTPEKTKTEKKTPEKVKIEEISPIKKEEHSPNDSKTDSDKDHSAKKKTQKKTPSSSKKPKKTSDESELDRSVYDPDEERQEKRRAAAILYSQFQKRKGPSNPGSKEIPKGKPNCLEGLAFVITGEFESMERDEAKSVIKDLGGRVVSAISGKTNYIIAGEDCGPAKMAKAEEMKIPVLSEDDLLDLIRIKSGLPPLNPKTKAAASTPSPNKEKKKSPKDKKADKSSGKHGHSSARNEPPEQEIKIEVDDIEMEEVDTKPNLPTQITKDVPLPWVDKYKPKTIKDIIGQQGPTSNCTKLIKWLQNWEKNNDGTKKHARPNPWGKSNDDGAAFKAALLSGPPGVGKTTTAQLVCQHLGYDMIEFNASDTRSKKSLQSEVKTLLSNTTGHNYYIGKSKTLNEKQVLIMDEVDGMAGNEDRGGMAELIALIKSSSVPIICMCNDRQHQKIRSLVQHCFDLRFARPNISQIKGAVMSILFKEKVKIPPQTIEEIIQATNNDVRQTLNSLSLISADPNAKGSGLRNDNGKKDLKIGPFEVVRKVFSAEEHKKMSLNDKSDLFFHDYNMAPLFVQQNYLSVVPNGPKSKTMEKVALAADSLSLGDLVENRIRSRMAWSLLPVQAMYSSFLPGEYMSGQPPAQINFPGWLGKNSKTQKRNRLAQEIHDHTRLRTSASRQSIRLDYAPFLVQNILQPLIDDKNEGIEESLSVINEYQLLRDDIDSLVELTTWPGKKHLMESVDGRVKAALTRTYNKEAPAYSYSAITTTKKKRLAASDGDYINELGEEGNGGSISDDDEDDDKVENDALIIKAKRATAKSTAKNKPSTSGTSKKATSSKATSSKATSSKKK